jgi:hypothetical protein
MTESQWHAVMLCVRCSKTFPLDGSSLKHDCVPAQPAPVSSDTRDECPNNPNGSEHVWCGRWHTWTGLCNECHWCNEPKPVAEASEDTEPARCPQILIGSIYGDQQCDLTAGHEGPHEDDYSRWDEHTAWRPQGAKAPAPASDDEMTPGPSVDVLWNLYGAHLVKGPSARNAPRGVDEDWLAEKLRLQAEVEAAIRAPLEAELQQQKEVNERVSEALPAMLEMAQGGQFLTGRWALAFRDLNIRARSAEEQLAAVTAERDDAQKLLNEAQSAMFDYLNTPGIYEKDVENFARLKAVLAPATEEVQG